MGKSNSTIHDVADLAGVSIATVSNALSGRKPVTPAVLKRVREAAYSLNYQVDRAASRLRSGKSYVVGVMVPNFTDTFFTSLVSLVENLAADASYQVIVASSQDDAEVEVARLDALMGWRPSGIIAVPTANSVPELLLKREPAMPVILVDRIGQMELDVDTVTMNNHAAGWKAAEHLLDRGHRAIAIASSVSALRPIAERIRGVSECCASRNLPAPDVVEVGIHHDRGAEIMSEWLTSNPHPTAILAMTNVTTLAALSAVIRCGLEVPKSMSLIGFDDYTWMSARKVPLTAIRQPTEAIVTAAWSQFMSRTEGANDPAHHIVFEASLQERASVARLV